MGRIDCIGVKAIAAALDVTERTVWRYVQEGMPVQRSLGRRVDGIAACLRDCVRWRQAHGGLPVEIRRRQRPATQLALFDVAA